MHKYARVGVSFLFFFIPASEKNTRVLFFLKILDWTTQAIGQQNTSPLCARCEARRREVAVICGCGYGLARDAPEASKVYGGLRAGGPQGLQAKPGGDTRPRANHRPRVLMNYLSSSRTLTRAFKCR